MQQLSVGLIPVLNDNYIFLLQRQGQAVVVDPAVAEPVIAALEQQGLELVAILHTHHHSDHIGGTPGLLARWPGAAVLASRDDLLRIPLQTKGVGDGDSFELLGEPVQVIAVPGHTRSHIAFHLPVAGHLFCGDTLFAGGCGRLFEGSATEMHESLQRLAQLPAVTRVWCAHEYTQANLRWAAAVVAPTDPCAGNIKARLTAVVAARARGEATIPSSVELERATNLFVRATSPEQLAELRRSKDHWPS
jgi:hydroxyacylglutathione hydrolase